LGDAPESWADDDPRVELLVRGREVEVIVKQAWKRCPVGCGYIGCSSARKHACAVRTR
jgi:hypothetical protein